MSNARLTPRVDYQMEVDVLKAGMGSPDRLAGQNLSQSGMFLAATDAYRIGDRISLRFNTDDEEEVYVRSAEVVWVRADQKTRFSTEPSGIGVRFLALESDERSQIGKYIHQNRVPENATSPNLVKERPEKHPEGSSRASCTSSARQWLQHENSETEGRFAPQSKDFVDWSFFSLPDSGIYSSADGEIDMGAPNSLVEKALTTFEVESTFDMPPHDLSEGVFSSFDSHTGPESASFHDPIEDEAEPFGFSIEGHPVQEFEKLDSVMATADTSIAEIKRWSARRRPMGKGPRKFGPPLAAICLVAVACWGAAFLLEDQRAFGFGETEPLSLAAGLFGMTDPLVEKLGSKKTKVVHETLRPNEQHAEASLPKTHNPITGQSPDPSRKTQKASQAVPQTPAATRAVDERVAGLIVERGRITLPLKNGEVVRRFVLDSPNRVVVDLVDAQFPGYKEKRVERQGINKLRIGKPDKKHVRVVVELRRNQPAYQITTIKKRDTLAIAWR